MKRVFALVLAAMMILTAMALTGCGDKDKKENASVSRNHKGDASHLLQLSSD